MYHAESAFHDLFDDKRVEGEWFDLDDEDLEYIDWIQREGIVDG